MRQVTHALLTRPPLSQISLHPERFEDKCFVRLACVRHAASVHPEPGSNSHVQSLVSNCAWLSLTFFTWSTFWIFLKSKARPSLFFSRNLQGFAYCLMFGFHGAVLLLSSAATVIYYNRSLLICQQLFLFFQFPFGNWELFLTARLRYHNIPFMSRGYFIFLHLVIISFAFRYTYAGSSPM